MENGGEQDLKHARRILFVSCFARQFLQWALQFNLVVWFYQTESGLFLISLFKATASFSVLTMVPRLSRRIDEAAAGTTLNRKQFATYVIIAENACVLVVAIALGFIVLNINKGYGSRNLMYSLVGISLLFGASYQVLYQVLLITMERDWIVVMASGNDDWLQKTNVILKQVFLVAKIISPVVTGKVLEISSGISWIVGCAILSFLIELMCIHQVFKLVPKLQQQHQKNPEKINKRNETSITKCSCLKNFQLYLSQSMVWAGLAYALFHSNVLTFNALMTTYLVSCGMSLSSIGIWKGVASFIGLLGTLAFGLSQKRMNLEATGLWGIVSQLLCLTVALGSIFVAKPDLSAILLISGVIPSRIGLWVFDISVAQLFQRTVPPTVRGQVGGLQTSLNAFFEYIPFVLGMIYSDVSDFSKLVIVGYTSVGAAAALYIVGIYVPYQNGGLKYNYMPVSDLVIVDEKQSGKLQLDGRGLEENQGIHY